MKCDDDTFIRVERILKDIQSMSPRRPLYLGNLNLLHRPLRTGKWAVSYEVCNVHLCKNTNHFTFNVRSTQ